MGMLVPYTGQAVNALIFCKTHAEVEVAGSISRFSMKNRLDELKSLGKLDFLFTNRAIMELI